MQLPCSDIVIRLFDDSTDCGSSQPHVQTHADVAHANVTTQQLHVQLLSHVTG